MVPEVPTGRTRERVWSAPGGRVGVGKIVLVSTTPSDNKDTRSIPESYQTSHPVALNSPWTPPPPLNPNSMEVSTLVL
eukprot:1196280-Prorocentrum_minimum.AAC.4